MRIIDPTTGQVCEIQTPDSVEPVERLLSNEIKATDKLWRQWRNDPASLLVLGIKPKKTATGWKFFKHGA